MGCRFWECNGIRKGCFPHPASMMKKIIASLFELTGERAKEEIKEELQERAEEGRVKLEAGRQRMEENRLRKEEKKRRKEGNRPGKGKAQRQGEQSRFRHLQRDASH